MELANYKTPPSFFHQTLRGENRNSGFPFLFFGYQLGLGSVRPRPFVILTAGGKWVGPPPRPWFRKIYGRVEKSRNISNLLTPISDVSIHFSRLLFSSPNSGKFRFFPHLPRKKWAKWARKCNFGPGGKREKEREPLFSFSLSFCLGVQDYNRENGRNEFLGSKETRKKTFFQLFFGYFWPNVLFLSPPPPLQKKVPISPNINRLLPLPPFPAVPIITHFYDRQFFCPPFLMIFRPFTLFQVRASERVEEAKIRAKFPSSPTSFSHFFRLPPDISLRTEGGGVIKVNLFFAASFVWN